MVTTARVSKVTSTLFNLAVGSVLFVLEERK